MAPETRSDYLIQSVSRAVRVLLSMMDQIQMLVVFGICTIAIDMRIADIRRRIDRCVCLPATISLTDSES